MAKLDKTKEEIGWLKIIFGVLFATDISLIAWLFQNYGNAGKFFLVLCAVTAFLITFVIVWINRVAYQKIDALEEL